ncbi:RNI-like protein [Rozella allomycis CSF55]|uniref:RNI-like protein n=1 Tax=Rozella allomycis (strain CSF55) TaxID=988480 RepID=A0A075AQZ7_ROZAC|nr:hypothetical protein O9G_001476 [Rozella allomycis CSF55]RKP22181.1 RNI-like protein [Rozella allomycis CSF55]|eukprot:EPZ31002.1 hypothetical protein O9G_001476 [Rozella allomycis CSF55]
MFKEINRIENLYGNQSLEDLNLANNKIRIIGLALSNLSLNYLNIAGNPIASFYDLFHINSKSLILFDSMYAQNSLFEVPNSMSLLTYYLNLSRIDGIVMNEQNRKILSNVIKQRLTYFRTKVETIKRDKEIFKVLWFLNIKKLIELQGRKFLSLPRLSDQLQDFESNISSSIQFWNALKLKVNKYYDCLIRLNQIEYQSGGRYQFCFETDYKNFKYVSLDNTKINCCYKIVITGSKPENDTTVGFIEGSLDELLIHIENLSGLYNLEVLNIVKWTMPVVNHECWILIFDKYLNPLYLLHTDTNEDDHELKDLVEAAYQRNLTRLCDKATFKDDNYKNKKQKERDLEHLQSYVNIKDAALNLAGFEGTLNIKDPLPNLKALNLQFNHLSGLVIQRELINITHLNIDYCFLASFDSIVNLPMLKELSAKFNKISSWNRICKVIKVIKQLQTLDLRFNPIALSSEYPYALTSSMKQLKKLDGKDFKRNNFCVGNFISSPILPMQEFILDFSDKCSPTSFNGVNHLKSFMTDSPIRPSIINTMKILILDNVGHLDLFQAIVLPSVERLSLCGNWIQDPSFIYSLTPNLECLHLDNNQIKEVGPISHLKKLWSLSLANNDISLSKWGISPLKRLNLSFNKVQNLDWIARIETLQELCNIFLETA